MKELTIINQNNQLLVDSREVAEMLGKRHSDLLESIDSYTSYLLNGNFRSADFFIESTYQDTTGRTLKCYLLTRKGCDMVANKMTGEKGVLFTAAYVTKFEEMEKSLKPACIEDVLIQSLHEMKNMRAQLQAVNQEVAVTSQRLNNLDCTNIEGTPRQRLNAMVRKYSFDKGIPYAIAWKEFKSKFNTSYGMNLEQRLSNYLQKQGIKNLTLPEYMERTGLIEDALRVADKMCNV